MSDSRPSATRSFRNPAAWLGALAVLGCLIYACRNEGPAVAPVGRDSKAGGTAAESPRDRTDQRPNSPSVPAGREAGTAAPVDPVVAAGASDMKKDPTGNPSAPADPLSKALQPQLANVLRDYKEGKALALPPSAVVADKTVPNLDVVVFLHEAKEPPAIEGVVFRSRTGAIASASIAVTAIERLARHGAVRYVSLPEPLKPKNDTSTAGSLLVIGQISIVGEIDNYSYFASAGESVTIRVHASDNPSTLNPAVEIHDTVTTFLAGDDDSGPDFDARLSFTFPATALYTIRVGSLVATSGPYHLIVESSETASVSFLTGGDINVANLPRYVGSSVLSATAGGTIGNNVLIGIIDSGIAWYHQDFITPAGASRILYLWDQARSDGVAPDVGVDGLTANDYGVEYNRATINSWIAAFPAMPPQPWPGFDPATHGTAVAGAAAGDGSDSDGGEPAGRYRGVSQGSDILFVRLGASGTILDALVYLASKAVELGRPIVINVSLGSNMGPHDGKGADAQVADLISGPGRIVVVAAGNEGIFPIHASTVVGGSAVLGYTILDPADANVDIWADAGDQFTVTVTSPGAQVLSATTGTSNAGTLDGWPVSISNRVGGPSALNGDTQIFIQFAPPSPLPGGAVPGWSITLTRTVAAGSGQIDAYASSAGTGAEFTTFVPAGAEPLSVAGTLTDLATAAQVLSIGAYSTKYRWDSDIGGTKTDDLARVFMGSLGHFSSRGPTRKGLVKPDLTGPGNKVTSSFSAESLGGATDPTDVSLDGRHKHLSGTSFSSPHVAGIVALLLEKNRYLSPTNVRSALQSSALTDQATGTPVTAPNSWGAGKVSAAAALAAAPAAPANTAPAAPSLLEQQDGAQALLALGATVSAGTVRFRATLTDADAQYMKLEVEVLPVGTAFTGTPTLSSPFVVSGDIATATLTTLANGSYHWRARAVDTGGGASSAALISPWSVFGGNLETEADFIVSIFVGGGGGGGGGGCGATGLELLIPLGVLGWLRRRRKNI